MEDNDLNTLMSRRFTPGPRKDLAESIIHAAIAAIREPERRANFWSELAAMFTIPHPSVAIITGILLGVVVGIQAGEGMTMLQQDWTSFLDINEGGWL